MNDNHWRKPSLSNANGACVEVFRGLSRLRDSKDHHGLELRVDVRALVAAVKADRLAR
jgi:hypothetical protein